MLPQSPQMELVVLVAPKTSITEFQTKWGPDSLVFRTHWDEAPEAKALSNVEQTVRDVMGGRYGAKPIFLLSVLVDDDYALFALDRKDLDKAREDYLENVFFHFVDGEDVHTRSKGKVHVLSAKR